MNEQDNKNLDKHIGLKIRKRRKELGMTQSDLAQIIGVSYQQVQRYESGENPLSMARVLEISAILNAKPEYFYEDIAIRKDAAKTGIIGKDASRPLKILLVEDSVTDEILFRKAAAASDIPSELEAIQNPENVVDYLKSGAAVDIILLDINMPRLSGIELLKEIKKDAKLRSIPVIMLTNSNRSKDMLEAYANNAAGFIRKNCEIDDFFADIDRILQYWSRVIILPSAAG